MSDQKAKLRQQMLSVRKAIVDIPFDRDLFLNHPEFKSAQTIAGYWPMAGEVDIRPLLAKLSRCCLPVVVQKQAPLVFRRWQSGDNLVTGPHQTNHPDEKAEVVVPDLVLVPLLAFDQQGGRLGFGGGYYDRTLSALDAIRLGVGYDEQEVDFVPMEPFDQRMDWIITPSRVIRCQN